MAMLHRDFSPGRLKAAQTPPASSGASGAVWASLIAHGVLMVGGLGYAASTTLGLATVPKESNITLEAASPAALLAPGREAEPDAPAPLPPAETPLLHDPLDLLDGGATSEPLPADPVRIDRYEPDERWQPFEGHVVARLRPPARTPVASEAPPVADAPAPSRPTAAPPATPGPVVAPEPLDDVNRKPRPRFGKGEVVVRVDVAADGTVDDVILVKRSGPRVLATSVINAVRVWRFSPATRDGRAVAHPFTARFVF